MSTESGSLDHVFKVLLIGDSGVGKSSILLQFSDGYFNDILPSTIGVDFKVKVLNVQDSSGQSKKIKVTIWDTAGQERFRTLTSSYYRGAQGIILVYDVSRKETFDNVSTWLHEIEQFSPGGGKDIIKILVGNKADQPRSILHDYANDWAKNRGLLFLETSAKTKEGISQVFDDIVRKILSTPELLVNTRPSSTKNVGRERGISVSASQASAATGSSCC